ncbi:MAG: amino acid permease [Chitinophagia bacterium]|nr:amino acid permease [Chitinophagia bacterium]
MSILMGIFANYGYVLSKAGPFGIWTWLLVGGGQLLVALVFAEMAGRVPLTGAIYNWNTKLTNPAVGWLTAWMTLFAYAAATVGVIVAIITPLQTLLGQEFSSDAVNSIAVGIMVSQALINIYGVRLAAYTNKLAVIAEIIVLVFFGLILLTVILMHSEANPELLITLPDKPAPYWLNFLMASLMTAWTIFGFESPADLAEETLNVRRVAPKSIISSVLITIVLGFVFISILTMAIPDLAAVTAASDPVSTIMSYHLGEMPTKLFLVVVLIAMFAVSLITMTMASRLIFAVARDKRLVAASVLSRISSHRVPHISIMVIAAIEIGIFFVAKSRTDFYATPVILLFLAYLVTVVSFLVGSKKLPSTDNFSLGRWHWPVAILAVFWLVAEIAILTIPDEFHSATEITATVLAVGVILYLMVGRRQ